MHYKEPRAANEGSPEAEHPPAPPCAGTTGGQEPRLQVLPASHVALPGPPRDRSWGHLSCRCKNRSHIHVLKTHPEDHVSKGRWFHLRRGTNAGLDTEVVSQCDIRPKS